MAGPVPHVVAGPHGSRVWCVAVADPLPGAWDDDCLSPEELQRSAAFAEVADRRRYETAHVALRNLLGEATGRAAGELELGRRACPVCGGPHGRPVLRAPGPEFSLAHGGDYAVVALAATPVGVDVEPDLPRPAPSDLLHPAEAAELDRLDPARRASAFTRLWTRKEAYLKGLGSGLGRPPHRDHLGETRPGDPPGWTLLDFVLPGHAGAVAVARP